jgi:serine/threonine-protein kinase RsbW
MNHSLTVQCSTEHLADIRSFLEKTLKSYPVSEDERSLMILAVDEICANVMIHSNRLDKNKNLAVSVTDTPEGYIFEISETGKAFDPDTIPEPDIKKMVKEKKKGGLGLMLVRKIMDSIELKKDNSQTIYRLFKRINPC